MAKVGIAFLVGCEALLCFMSGAMSYVYFESRGGIREYAHGGVALLIVFLSIWAVVGLLRKGRYAWWSSFAIGLIVIGLSSYAIWFGITYANPQTDEGDAVIFGVALLFFALPAPAGSDSHS